VASGAARKTKPREPAPLVASALSNAMDEDMEPAAPKAPSAGKQRPVEEVYQKMTQLEHILLRPDTYIGSIEAATQPMWVWSDEHNCMIFKNTTYVPGLYKIFDEILVNAADNKVHVLLATLFCVLPAFVIVHGNAGKSWSFNLTQIQIINLETRDNP
jgi:DNA topoisomerase-2